MTYDADERSVSGSRPIDLYTIETPTSAYRLTSHVVDVTFGGFTYVALTMTRGPLEVAQDLTGHELIVQLPISHPIVQRYVAFGIPEHEVLVTVRRLQSTSGVAIQQAQGFGQSISINGRLAALRVPSVTDDSFKVALPLVRVSKLCNHVLFDPQCAISRDAFTVLTNVVAQAGTTLVVGTIGGNPDGWAAPSGEVVHAVTSERRQIIAQVGTTLTINAPFVIAQPGDGIAVSASCDHSLGVCKAKFNNVANYGGFPHLNSAVKPWVPGGYGVIVQQ